MTEKLVRLELYVKYNRLAAILASSDGFVMVLAGSLVPPHLPAKNNKKIGSPHEKFGKHYSSTISKHISYFEICSEICQKS